MWVFYYDVSNMTPIQNTETNIVALLFICFACSICVTFLGMRSGMRSE